MGAILYTSNQSFFVKTDAEVNEFTSERISTYINTIKKINQKNEWKTSGAGAKFMNAYVPAYDDEATRKDVSINGVARYGEDIIYSATTGEISGLFKKVLQNNMAEGLVISNRDMQIYKLSVRDDKCAASIGLNNERHIAIFNIETGSYRELTEGEVIEDYPSYSNDGSIIYFSSAGLAISYNGFTIGVGPYGIFCYHIQSNEMDEMLASEKHDYIAPKEDKDGNLLFIKRPYKGAVKDGNIFMDILMFPIRIIRAIGGLLNYFSIMFGGESLRSGRTARDVKAKQRSEKDIFFDGNVISAQEMQKASVRRGEKFPGIIPHSWELIRLDEDGNQHCLKKGVMDYIVCKNGDIVYSNGSAIIRLLKDGSEHLIEKCRMANNLVEVGD